MASLSAMGCRTSLLALTAMERWTAVKHIKPDTSVPTWLIVAVGVALIILIVSALVSRYKQRPRKSVLRQE